YAFSSDGGVTFGTQNIFSGYGPGTEGGFYIRDSRGCISPEITVTIADSDPLLANSTPSDAVCNAGVADGSISTTVTDGVGPYDYRVFDIGGNEVQNSMGSPSTSVNFNNLPTGNYTVVVVDAQGCEVRNEVEIDQNVLDLVPLDTDPIDCSDEDFPYRVRATGGTAPYEFRLVGSPGFTLGTGPNQDIFDVTGLVVPGVTYFVEVMDANGCFYIEEIDAIGGPNPVNVAATAGMASCNVAGSGSIDYTVDGISGGGNCTIWLWNTDTGAQIEGPTAHSGESIPYNDSFTGLAPGNYQIEVRDDDTNCRASTLEFIGMN